MGVSDLAKKLKMAKSTVHGMASTLEELGAVMRDPGTKKYKLGFTLLGDRQKSRLAEVSAYFNHYWVLEM